MEVKHAVWREITEKRVLVLPFIIDDTPIDSVLSDQRFWFLGQRHLTTITQDASGASRIVTAVRQALERRSFSFTSPPPSAKTEIDPRIEKLLGNVKLGDWYASRDAAFNILESTDEFGNNNLFQSLLAYLCSIKDNDLRWGAIQTIESLAELAPWLFDHALLARMANSPIFEIRGLAASICMDFAQFAPDRVPLDIAFRLSRHDEDWYVMAPATAALKAMAKPCPAVLSFFYRRLHDQIPEAREHAAEALADIAEKEPEILDPEDLQRELAYLLRIGDRSAASSIAQAASKAKRVEHRSGYKYGI